MANDGCDFPTERLACYWWGVKGGGEDSAELGSMIDCSHADAELGALESQGLDSPGV